MRAGPTRQAHLRDEGLRRLEGCLAAIQDRARPWTEVTVSTLPAMTTPVLEARGLTRQFGNVTALDGADFDIYPGEVVALIGDNGAGKSTLVKALSGNLEVDSGEVHFKGQQIVISTPTRGQRARHRDRLPGPRAGAAPRPGAEHVPGPGDHASRLRPPPRVHGQQGHARGGRGGVRTSSAPPCAAWTRRSARCRAASDRRSPSPVRCTGPRTSSSSTSPPPRSAYARPRTSSTRSAGCASHGVAVVFISHSMPHVIEVSDRVQVLRMGKRVATYKTSGDIHGGAGRSHDRRRGRCSSMTTTATSTARPSVGTAGENLSVVPAGDPDAGLPDPAGADRHHHRVLGAWRRTRSPRWATPD